ncbi:MAG: hypothetical protein E7582_03995 [Ruminococcaceae bacterium]|nr:hypothetical protein [Oscillospiraceae bacterium]
MKKITLILTLVLILFSLSCSEKYTYKEREDGTIIRSDSTVFYPLENSYRYTDLGYGKKVGSILSYDIFPLESEDAILVKGLEEEKYYVTEDYKSLDILFEECHTFLFVNKNDLDKKSRVSEKYIEKAEKLTGKTAEDFAFYVFYGRTPEEEGYKRREYFGEIIALFDTPSFLLSSYPVYKYSPTAYSVEIDGEEYMLEIRWSREIGIIEE